MKKWALLLVAFLLGVAAIVTAQSVLIPSPIPALAEGCVIRWHSSSWVCGGLTDYENNVAAISGGLTAGAFYTETGTNPKRVCVVFIP